jgi:hypothetical protein
MIIKFKKQVINIKGAIFCQVIIIKHLAIVTDSVTWGNQAWNGAIPALIARDKKITILKLFNVKILF